MSETNLDIAPEELAEIDALLEATPDIKPSTQDLRAAFFEKHRNELLLGLKHMSLRALKRCVAAVALGELATKEYRPQSALEKNFVNHFNECVKMRAQMVFEEEMLRLTQAWEKEQADLEKIQAMTNAELSEDAKELLKEKNVDINTLDNQGVLTSGQ